MSPNAKVLKATPRIGKDGKALVELTLKWGAHKNVKVTVPVPADGIFRKNEGVNYDSTNKEEPVTRPAPPTSSISA
jgi:hypothetical protein